MSEISRMPYIGVTGITDEEQAHLLCMRLGEHEDRINGTLTPGRRLMLGVLVSDKTLRGESNKHPKRFPPIGWLPRIFKTASDSGDALTLRIVHYNTHDPAALADQLIRLYNEYGGVNMNGIQLNVCWPDPRQIEKYLGEVPSTHRIILQIGSRAMQDVSAYEIGARVKDYYSGLITDILVDPSGGLGLQADLRNCGQILEEVCDQTQGNIGLGFAGGLSGESKALLRHLYWNFPTVSIDAEGRLRDDNDHLDIEKTIEYIENARAALQLAKEIQR